MTCQACYNGTAIAVVAKEIQMQVKGKFFIRHNIASGAPYYWSQPAQNWTMTPHDATFFDTREAAEDEARYAQDYGPGEAYVLQATRDLPEREAA